MKHVSQQMLSPELRGPHARRTRTRLHEQLHRPGLPQEEVGQLRRQLAELGREKSYAVPEAVTPASIDPGPMPLPPVELDLSKSTYESLSSLPHSRLFSFATQLGLDVRVSATKAQVAGAIWKFAQGERQ